MRMSRLPFALVLAWVLAASAGLAGCGGGSGTTTLDVLDLPGGDQVPTDATDVPGSDEGRPDGAIETGEDGVEPEIPGEDASTDAPTDGTPADVPALDVGPDAPPAAGTCAVPTEVWDGRTLGPDYPATSLVYEEGQTSATTAATAPSCGPGGTQGELVFRMVLGRTTYVITSVESQAFDFTPVVTYVKESCAGAEADCTQSDDLGVMAELATALTPGTWIVIVHLVPRQDGLDPVGVAVDVSFDFEPGEDCTNQIDDNSDGDTDCDDPSCFADPACTGGHSGETCADPFPVFDGRAPVSGDEFFGHGTLGGRTDDYHADASCWPGSAGSGDAVWRVVLDQEMILEIAVSFYDGIDGQAYVLDEACTTIKACLPAQVQGDPNLLVTLPAGTWNIVVDRGPTPPTNPNFDLYVFFDEP